MKIAYCVPELHIVGGLERVLILKANYLASQGVETHFIITDNEGKKPAYPISPNVHIHQLNINFGASYQYSFLHRAYLNYKKIRHLKHELNECLCQIRPDIAITVFKQEINVINQMTDGSIKIGEAHTDKDHIWTFEKAPFWIPTFVRSMISSFRIYLIQKKIKKLSKFIVLTHEDAQSYTGLKNLTVIPNPVSFIPSQISTCTNKQVIAAGRYVEIKGFDRLIAAWKQVNEKYPDWILKIYGEGPLREQFTAQAARLGLQNSCFLEHAVPNIATKLQESSIFVLSSRFEGFGMVIVEAMACGLPVVSYACQCGPRDIISEGIDGLLVKEGDINGLATGINQLIENDELRQKMGRQARKKAEQYTIEKIGKQWINLFESLIESKNSNR